jgi:hypothetical protein
MDHKKSVGDFCAEQLTRGEPAQLKVQLPPECSLDPLSILRVVYSGGFNPHRIRIISERDPVTLASLLLEHGDDYDMSRANRVAFIRLQEILYAGGTFVVEDVDRYVPWIGDISTEIMTRTFSRVCANCYVAGRKSNSFGIHWDSHDVLILHLQGRKNWKFAPGVLRAPLERDRDINKISDDAEFSSATLERGDLLYLPRGYWHDVRVVEPVSMHLTFAVNPPTGADYLKFMSEYLKSEELVRADMTLFDDSSFDRRLQDLHGTVARAHSQALKDAFKQMWIASLPVEDTPNWDAHEILGNDTTLTKLRLIFKAIGNVRREIDATDGSMQIVCLARRFVFPKESVPVMNCLLSQGEISFAEMRQLLVAAKPLEANLDAVRDFTWRLYAEGLVSLQVG